MKTNLTIHISGVERLLSDSLITSKEYKDIMKRIVDKKIEEVNVDG